MKLKIAVIALCTAALFAYAQPFGRGGRFASTTSTGTATPPAPVDAVKTYLSLTDSQVTGFQAIRQTAQTAAQPVMDQLRTKHDALRTAMNANPIVPATVSALQAEITALETQLKKFQTDASAQMKALLGADQKTKLATLEAAAALRDQVQGAAMIGLIDGPSGRGGPGFGGPGGRGKDKGGRGPF